MPWHLVQQKLNTALCRQTDSTFPEPALLHIDFAKQDVLPLAEPKTSITLGLLLVHKTCWHILTAASTAGCCTNEFLTGVQIGAKACITVQ